MYKSNVLVVDDEDQIRRLICDSLGGLDCNIIAASSGSTAVTIMENVIFNFVSTDYNMSGISGTTVVKKAKEINPDVRVIIMTGSQDIAPAIEAIKLKADDYLLKPFKLSKLRKCISGYIDEIKRSQIESSQMNKVKKPKQKIRNILQVMSHDIRGPIVSIGADLKLLRRGCYGKLENRSEQIIEGLYRKIHKLNGILGDFLIDDFSDSSNSELTREEFDLSSDIIAPVLDELSEDMESRNIVFDNRFSSVYAGKLPITANRILLKSAFRNLFSNAVKYGAKGCAIGFEVEDQNTVYCGKVFNSGKPVPEQHRNKLFTKFTRYYSSGNGTGLGLYLSRQIFQMHGGNIWYEARPCGSNFLFTLPNIQNSTKPAFSISEHQYAQTSLGTV